MVRFLKCQCVKSVRIRNYPGPDSGNMDQNNSEYGQFLRSALHFEVRHILQGPACQRFTLNLSYVSAVRCLLEGGVYLRSALIIGNTVDVHLF